MNSITDLLDLEDNDVIIKNIDIQGQTKVLTLETPPTAHFCPVCGFRMYSRGVKERTINHPILQDNYSLVLILKQRRWRCINPDCHYSTSIPSWEQEHHHPVRNDHNSSFPEPPKGPSHHTYDYSFQAPCYNKVK